MRGARARAELSSPRGRCVGSEEGGCILEESGNEEEPFAAGPA